MRSTCFSLALLAAFAIPAAARADVITISGGGNTLTFSLPASPTASFYGDGFFDLNDVVVTYNNLTSTDDLSFYTSDNGGGFGDNFFGDPYSAQLFTGDVSAPAFAPGTYAFTDLPGGPTAGIVTITGATAEPSGLLLFGTGTLGMAGVTRRRRD